MTRKKKKDKKTTTIIIVVLILVLILINGMFFGIRYDSLEPYPDGTELSGFADIEQIGHIQASYLAGRSHNPASPAVVLNKECNLIFDITYSTLIRDPASEYYTPDQPQIIFKLYRSTAQFEAVADFLALANETIEIAVKTISTEDILESASKTNGMFLQHFDTAWETGFELTTEYMYGFFVEITDSIGQEIDYTNNPNCASFFILFSDKEFKLYANEDINPTSPIVIIMPITTTILVAIIGILVYVIIKKKKKK